MSYTANGVNMDSQHMEAVGSPNNWKHTNKWHHAILNKSAVVS